ncbi:hypothetical protein ACH5RR_018143 [Cinchona calisaya]|uniref:Uncharacterized protein n=1 Tax=Cinchona calisaya TaxID=153742 RepID=A0ABD2ZLI1_9GENT
MEELIRVAEIEFPLWITTMDYRMYFLNEDAYYNMFSKAIELKPARFNIEASKEIDIVLINRMNLVEVFMDMVDKHIAFHNLMELQFLNCQMPEMAIRMYNSRNAIWFLRGHAIFNCHTSDQLCIDASK